MRRQDRRLAGAALALLALAPGCATVQPAAAPRQRVIVHVDTLDPTKVNQYEGARVRWVAALRQRGLSDHRGLFFKIGEHTYYSLVPFGRWQDLDRLDAERARAQATTQAVMKPAAEEYQRLCDDALVFPHGNEIWAEQPALSYAPTGRPLTDAVMLVIEDIRPIEDYEAAWKPIAAALAQAKYPVERRAYVSAYGSGRTLSFWLAPSAAVLRTAPTVEQALVAAVGAERAAELMRAWQQCVLRAQTLEVEHQPDMASP